MKSSNSTLKDANLSLCSGHASHTVLWLWKKSKTERVFIPTLIYVKVYDNYINPFLCFVLFFRFLKYICKYILAVFRHTRREHWIPLQMVVSHHVVVRN